VVVEEEGAIEVLTDPQDLQAVREAMQAAGLTPEQAEVTMRASTTTVLGEREAGSMVKLLETLDELDDVQQVYSNADIPDEILANLD
jgi:transcriptional/translational regulatory protein YebC/TACO1